MCVTLYDDFLGDKGLGLLRGDVSNHLTREVGIDSSPLLMGS